MNREKIAQIIRIVTLGLILSVGVGYALAGPPTASPPGGNTAPPIRAGMSTEIQARNSNLYVNDINNSLQLPVGNIAQIETDWGQTGIVVASKIFADKITAFKEFCLGADCITEWGGLRLAGSSSQTIRHNGTNWVASSLLKNTERIVTVQRTPVPCGSQQNNQQSFIPQALAIGTDGCDPAPNADVFRALANVPVEGVEGAYISEGLRVLGDGMVQVDKKLNIGSGSGGDLLIDGMKALSYIPSTTQSSLKINSNGAFNEVNIGGPMIKIDRLKFTPSIEEEAERELCVNKNGYVIFCTIPTGVQYYERNGAVADYPQTTRGDCPGCGIDEFVVPDKVTSVKVQVWGGGGGGGGGAYAGRNDDAGGGGGGGSGGYSEGSFKVSDGERYAVYVDSFSPGGTKGERNKSAGSGGDGRYSQVYDIPYGNGTYIKAWGGKSGEPGKPDEWGDNDFGHGGKGGDAALIGSVYGIKFIDGTRVLSKGEKGTQGDDHGRRVPNCGTTYEGDGGNGGKTSKGNGGIGGAAGSKSSGCNFDPDYGLPGGGYGAGGGGGGGGDGDSSGQDGASGGVGIAGGVIISW